MPKMPALGYWGAWMCVSEQSTVSELQRQNFRESFIHTNKAWKEELRFFCSVNVQIVGVPAQLGQSLRLGSLYAGTVAFHSGNLAVGVDGDGAIVNDIQLSARLAVDKGAKQQLVSSLVRMHHGSNLWGIA